MALPPAGYSRHAGGCLAPAEPSHGVSAMTADAFFRGSDRLCAATTFGTGKLTGKVKFAGTMVIVTEQ